jgi:hypothetical protein
MEPIAACRLPKSPVPSRATVMLVVLFGALFSRGPAPAATISGTRAASSYW